MKLTESQLRKIIRNETKSVLREATSPRKRSLVSLIFEEEDIAKGEELEKLDVSKGPTETIAWLNGPGADPRVRALLNSGRRDGAPTDEAAKVAEGSATIGNLKPTQIEIELTKSIAFPLSKFDSLKKMISGGVQRVGPPGNDMIVTSGDLIIDGHHRWSSLFSVAGPDGQIASIDISLPEKDAGSVLAVVQTAIASTLTGGEPVPKAKAGGMNILGKGKDELVKLIESAADSGGGEAGAILTDEFMKKCLGDKQVSSHFSLEGITDLAEARKKIIDKVADNLSKMNPPAEGAPPRVDMPQLDQAKGGVQGALDKIAAGKVNYKPPFDVVKDKKDSADKKESLKRSEDVLIERWQRLAGLVK